MAYIPRHGESNEPDNGHSKGEVGYEHSDI
jgi:hypothetical protein